MSAIGSNIDIDDYSFEYSKDEIKSLKSMINDKFVSDDEKVFMHFALAKAYEDEEDFKKSFEHYKKGNDYKNTKSMFNLKDFEIECQNQKEVCTKDLFETNRKRYVSIS